MLFSLYMAIPGKLQVPVFSEGQKDGQCSRVCSRLLFCCYIARRVKSSDKFQ